MHWPLHHKISRLVVRQRLAFSGLAILFAGGLVLNFTHASTPNTSGEAESGTLASCASTLSDSSASSGSAVKFTSCSSGGNSTPTNLDASGNTVPDTNYAIPAGAIFMSTTGNDSNPGTKASPVKTITQAINMAPSGGTVVVRGGTYRDWYHSWNSNLNTYTFGVVSKPITIQAYPHETVWFDGTDVEPTSSWTSDGSGHWYMTWNTPSFCGTLPNATVSNYYSTSLASQNIGATNGTHQGPCVWTDGSLDPTNPMAGDPQMVFVNGSYEHEATSLSGATGGAFYYDWANKKIYISTNPSGNTIELAARPKFIQLNGAGSKVLGIGFKRYASHIYSNNPGVIYADNGTTIENDVFTRNAGAALMLTNPHSTVVNHSVFAFNGENGIGGNGSYSTGITDDTIIKNSVFNNNNTELFDTNCSYSCGAANIKLNNMIGFTIENNILENAQGHAHGAWCDLACTGGNFLYNTIHGNGDDGIVYEISSTGIIASNLVYDNSAIGISVGSATTKIYNNTVVGNGSQNIWVYDDPRNPADPDPSKGSSHVGPDTTGIYLANNVISGSSEAVRVQGNDSCNNTNGCSTNTVPSQFFSLFDYNSYYRSNGTGQTLIDWIPPTNRTYYTSLAQFTTDFGYGTHGQDTTSGGDPFFVNANTGDYRIRTSSTAYQSAASLPSDVANALGVSTAAGKDRGALNWPGRQ